jgi:hypothetical protein
MVPCWLYESPPDPLKHPISVHWMMTTKIWKIPLDTTIKKQMKMNTDASISQATDAKATAYGSTCHDDY